MNDSVFVPNCFPKLDPGEKRLAVIGEAPGSDEVVAGEPFVGVSGRLLRAVLSSTGIACDRVFFGNICNHQPPRNEIETFSWDGPEITSGLERLRTDLSRFRPNCILSLGRTPFRAFRPDLCYQSKKGYVIPLADWRGSISHSGAFGGYKIVGTYHPAYILRSYADIAYFKFDVARAVRQSATAAWTQPERGGVLRPSLSDVLSFCSRIEQTPRPLSWDIEGYCDDVGITMLCLCDSPSTGIVIPFWLDGKNYWSADEEVFVWEALAHLLANPLVPKRCHNAFYELFVSAWRHRLIINNVVDDTMMKHWERFPEAGGDPEETDTGKKRRAGLGRSLADCCSLYTEQPYYKAGRLSEDSDVKLRYNLTDGQVTEEISNELERELSKTPRSLSHYRFNVNLIPACNYIMLRGCRFDLPRARDLASEVEREIHQLTEEIDGHVLPAALAADVLTRKRKSDPWHFNVKSSPQKQWLLYEHLGYKKLPSLGDGADEDVLLHYWKREQNPVVRLVIRAVRRRTRLQDIHKLLTSADGRIRSGYDLVGTNTGRLSSRSSIAMEFLDGEWANVGTNLQNVTKELRCCFIPDSPDFDFWQFDLSGADGWTVGADLAAVGHPAMLEDYLSGIKPALVLYYMLQEHAAGRNPADVNRLPREQLKLELKRIKNEIDQLEGKLDASGRPADWQYLCCKRVQHGSNYGAFPDKIAEVVFGDSDGAIVLDKREAARYQSLYKLRYNTDARNEAIRRELSNTGTLVAACGIRRQFFSIRNRRDIDDATVREASAFGPQANTTWATNKALERLWYDIKNRTSRGGLFVEPLLQIHDAIAGQYRARDREWAGQALRGWFDNPLTISGTKLVIPADGKWGANWKDCKNSIN